MRYSPHQAARRGEHPARQGPPHEQAVALLAELLPRLAAQGWRVAPVVVVRGARVALVDEVGELFGAKVAMIALGERPGLGAADSLGAYFVHTPRVGNTDAQRNCVSNIRRGGLSSRDAAQTLEHLLLESLQRGISGFELKDLRALRPALR
ncbi:MAG: ethanolamine ammonia-lyase light chain EutC [Lacipirellulaceae bacterium]